jgi:enoyl-CoA hydratase/carnithine racemase
LLKVAGPATTLELLLEGRLLDASEALARRLVSRVIPSASFETEIEAVIARITAQAPLAQRITKRLLRALLAGELTEAQRADAFSYAESLDHHEGVAAFLERRPPNFIGK